MYSKIMVAYNGTAESRSALDECVQLTFAPSAEVHLLVVANPPPLLMEYTAAAAMAEQEESLAEKRKMEHELTSGHAFLANAGLKVIDHLEVGEPVNTIAALADRLGIELVIVGHSHHKPWGMRWWRGSTDAALIEKVRCSILIAAARHA